jgi:hypothetical protein
MSQPIRWFTFAAPSRFYALADAVNSWLWAIALLLAIAALYIGFLVAPTDATQGDSYRIIFIHVPAAWMSMVLYVAMAFWAAIGWMFNARMASMLARALAPTGALFTFLALWTGSFWGKPTWGTWWVWDARLTSELILLFLYLGYIALVSSIDDAVRGDFVEELRKFPIDANTYVIMVSRGHKQDELALREVAASVAAYVGMIGSLRRVSTVLTHLAQEGVPRAALESVHTPIGLDIGAETPEEIAVSVVAELVLVRRGGTGRKLSELRRARIRD